MDRDRRLSYLILKDIEENHRWSNISVGHFLAKERADNPAFVRELVYGVIRNRILLDYNIAFYLKKPKLDTSLAIWLRMGFYQLVFMDGVKPYAAIAETVALAKAFKKGSEGFINGVLRSFQRDELKLRYPDEMDELKYLSVKYSADESIVNLWLNAYGKEQTEILLSESNKAAPLCLRVNTLKLSREALIEKLSALGFEAKESNICKTAIFASGNGILDTDLFKEGYFSVQGLSSQLAIEMAEPKAGFKVLDLCAAPGGKSCAMAETMEDKGEILAFDIYPHRVELINKEALRLGIKIIKAGLSDASQQNNDYLETADLVLCDVPCSGLGTLRENPEIKLRTVDQIDVQAQILKNGLSYLKENGTLIYSTCTINPKENTDLVKGALLNEYRIVEEKQIFTQNDCDGFYICKIRRKLN